MPTHKLNIDSDSDWFSVSITSAGAIFTSEGREFVFQGNGLGQGLLTEGLTLKLSDSSIRMLRTHSGGTSIAVGVRTDLDVIGLRVCKGDNGSVKVQSRFDVSVNNQVLGDGKNCDDMAISLTKVGREAEDDRYARELAQQ